MTRRDPEMRPAHDDWSTGDTIAAGVGFLVTLLLLLLGIALIAPFVHAHEAMSGWQYPLECCAGFDCAEISESRVKPAPGGYLVDGQFHVQQSDVKNSPDGRYHACFPRPDTLRCLFVPPAGS